YNTEDNLYQVSVPGGAIVSGGWSDISEGSMVEARITGANTGGLECEVSNIRGFIPVSQISMYRVENTADYVGQKLVCVVTEANGKISLSHKNPEEHPWTNIEQRFPVGSTGKGPVSRIAQFGAFVKLAPGVEGLIHISELAHHKVYKVENVVKEGEEVECKVLDVDSEAQRMSLSLKAAIAKPEKTGDEKEKKEVEEPPRELAVPKRSGPLKGGVRRSAGGDGGEQFGLKW